MKEKFKQLSNQDKKLQIHRIVARCEQLAEDYVKTWTAPNPSWETIEGCAYLRLSTDEQVAVEKGSLEQQVNIAVSEAVLRSNSERVNYKITKFYIEPGLTGRNDNRPRFQELMKAITNKQHSFVVIKEIARIARETEIWKKAEELSGSEGWDFKQYVLGIFFYRFISENLKTSLTAGCSISEISCVV